MLQQRKRKRRSRCRRSAIRSTRSSPNIDTMTMQIHHDNHHGGYVKNLNGIAEKWPDLAKKPIEDILSNLSVVPDEFRTAVRNNLGGHWNHTYFWD
jgi:superoxide dismutase, Fe-Mn family